MNTQDVITKIESLEIDSPQAEELRAAAIAFVKGVDDPEVWELLDKKRGIDWNEGERVEISFYWTGSQGKGLKSIGTDVWIDGTTPRVFLCGFYKRRYYAYETFRIDEPYNYKSFLLGLLLRK